MIFPPKVGEIRRMSRTLACWKIRGSFVDDLHKSDIIVILDIGRLYATFLCKFDICICWLDLIHKESHIL